MGKQDEKLIEKIEKKPYGHNITFEELEKYYKLHEFYPEKQNSTSHVHFKNLKTGERVTVPKRNPVKPSYIKQAVSIVHDDE